MDVRDWMAEMPDDAPVPTEDEQRALALELAKDDADQAIEDEFREVLAQKDPRTFTSSPCPGCGKTAGFLVEPDGSLWPATCLPCARERGSDWIGNPPIGEEDSKL
jgi:hypothetical protein